MIKKKKQKSKKKTRKFLGFVADRGRQKLNQENSLLHFLVERRESSFCHEKKHNKNSLVLMCIL